MKLLLKKRNIVIIVLTMFALLIAGMPFPDQVGAGTSSGFHLAMAILADPSTYVSSSYVDTDRSGTRQAKVMSSLGILTPTHGSTFLILSTGIAGTSIVTTNERNPGCERGTWFRNRYGLPRDQATLTMVLQVPDGMHYLYYDVQFLSAEYPEYVGSVYNDKLTITVISPTHGTTEYVIDVNSGDFVLDSNDLTGSGFDIFSTTGDPNLVDWVDTTPRPGAADAGATALVTRGARVHPNEQITVIIDIIDVGDNQFDSAAFLDNFEFTGYAKTNIVARKEAEDLNGGFVECGDMLKYKVTISNIGAADQPNNDGNEFEDLIPTNTTYVPGSLTATSGIIEYDAAGNKIIWNGELPALSSVVLTYKVTVDEGLPNGAEIFNQGTVLWDSTFDGTNDAIKLTDDPTVPGDDQPTILYVTVYEQPSVLTEDFSDDIPGRKASQTHYIYTWFETSEKTGGSSFEVAGNYQYLTPQAFKTKLRAYHSPQYWNYDLSPFNSDMIWWESWFACGNASEPADLLLSFKNKGGDDIARIKFEYVQQGIEVPTDYVVALSYWNPATERWSRLYSDYPGGYLWNDWYKLRIEKESEDSIRYSLYRSGKGLISTALASELDAPFSDFKQVVWSSTKNPVVCPLFFWDDHSIGLVMKE